MKDIQREDIYLISRHSNLDKQDVDLVLKAHVYHHKAAWQKFLQLFLVTLGIGFAVSGIVFFFAYNWADLHKFAKIGLIQGLLIATTSLCLLLKISDNLRRIMLTGSAVLVGVLFAVFGQVYQTGANAYDFFLVWTIFITLWVVISDFAPLWLLYLILINATLVLYTQQVANNWPEMLVFILLFVINTMVAIVALLLSKYRKTANVPNWFLYTVVLAAVSYATIGIVIGIFDKDHLAFPVLITIATLGFAAGIWHGLKARNAFYLSVIPFGLIVIGSALLIKISHGETMWLLVSLFIIASVTLLIKNLMGIQKNWTNEK